MNASLSFLDSSFGSVARGGGSGGLVVADMEGSAEAAWDGSVGDVNTLLWKGFTALLVCAQELSGTCAGCDHMPEDWVGVAPKDEDWFHPGSVWVPKASDWVNPGDWAVIIDPWKTDAAWVKEIVCGVHGDEVTGKEPGGRLLLHSTSVIWRPQAGV